MEYVITDDVTLDSYIDGNSNITNQDRNVMLYNN